MDMRTEENDRTALCIQNICAKVISIRTLQIRFLSQCAKNLIFGLRKDDLAYYCLCLDSRKDIEG